MGRDGYEAGGVATGLTSNTTLFVYEILRIVVAQWQYGGTIVVVVLVVVVVFVVVGGGYPPPHPFKFTGCGPYPSL